MILGHSSAAAAAIAIDRDQAVQDVDYAELRKRLLQEKQVLDLPEGLPAKVNVDLASLPGIIVDNTDARATGDWSEGTTVSPFLGRNYAHDRAAGKGHSMTYTLPIATAGRYELRISYTANANRASNVTVTVNHADGAEVYRVNQKKKPEVDGLFHRLGVVRLDSTHNTVVITNEGADGHVIADAVQAIPVK